MKNPGSFIKYHRFFKGVFVLRDPRLLLVGVSEFKLCIFILTIIFGLIGLIDVRQIGQILILSLHSEHTTHASLTQTGHGCFMISFRSSIQIAQVAEYLSGNTVEVFIYFNKITILKSNLI